MIIKEIQPKTILSISMVYPYVINSYIGCQHNCSYCYARFMKRFSGHHEPWGQFVDVKVNAPELLKKVITRKRPGSVTLKTWDEFMEEKERNYESIITDIYRAY